MMLNFDVGSFLHRPKQNLKELTLFCVDLTWNDPLAFQLQARRIKLLQATKVVKGMCSEQAHPDHTHALMIRPIPSNCISYSARYNDIHTHRDFISA